MPLFNLSINNQILVGNGGRIRITGYGYTSIALNDLALRDVLLAPQTIKT